MEQFLKQLINIIFGYLFGNIPYNSIASNIKLAADNSAIHISDDECVTLMHYIGTKLQEHATRNLTT